MSEYQYYEFLALDRPLTVAQQSQLRALSTRAEITASSFFNEYHYGDFKGDPAKLMREYFDAHVYLANWGSRRLMLSLPLGALAVETLEPYCVDGTFADEGTGSRRILDWSVNFEDYEYLDEGGAGSWMARLVPLRDELLRGDTRCLYLGWLAAANHGELEDDEPEPPVPAGLGQPTAAQVALVEFLAIDEDLFVGVTTASPPRTEAEPSQEDVDAWIADLPRTDLDRAFGLLVAGHRQEAEALAKSRYNAWCRSTQPQAEAPAQAARTVADLLELAEQARQRRQQREAERQAQIAAEKRRQREAYLAGVASNPEPLWTQAHNQAERGNAQGYQEAARLIVDLADAHALRGGRAEFDSALARFMEVHGRRRALVQRLTQAGLWR